MPYRLQVFVPFTRQYEYVKEFKQAHRRDDDIAIVNAGMRFAMTQDEQGESWCAHLGVKVLSERMAQDKALIHTVSSGTKILAYTHMFMPGIFSF